MITRFAKTLLALLVALFVLTSIAFLHPPTRAHIDPWTGNIFAEGGVENDLHKADSKKVEHGKVIMPHLGNATAKATLGRATWKLLHTMTLRFPEHPTASERAALESYLHLTARLYPCGECAAEFQQLLQQYPPQTSSRRAAAVWLCFLHNKVNARLQKPEFDCANLDSEYDCGCGDKPVGTSMAAADAQDTARDRAQDEVTGAALIKGGR